MLQFHASPSRWRVLWERVTTLAGDSPQLNTQMEAVAEDMRSTAESTYRAKEIGTGQGNVRRSFVKRRFRRGWAVVLADEKAAWVEAGALAGGKTPVLAYRPLRAAMDRGESEGARVRTMPGILAPRTRRAA
jgi:hypothetical protein